MNKKIMGLMLVMTFLMITVTAMPPIGDLPNDEATEIKPVLGESNCYDSDVNSWNVNGLNYYEKGYVNYNLDYAPEHHYTVTDSCTSMLNEFVCEGRWAVTKYYACPNGCENGVCLLHEDGMACENDFQCESNSCIDDECLNRNNFERAIQWILSKFRRLSR